MERHGTAIMQTRGKLMRQDTCELWHGEAQNEE